MHISRPKIRILSPGEKKIEYYSVSNTHHFFASLLCNAYAYVIYKIYMQGAFSQVSSRHHSSKLNSQKKLTLECKSKALCTFVEKHQHNHDHHHHHHHYHHHHHHHHHHHVKRPRCKMIPPSQLSPNCSLKSTKS